MSADKELFKTVRDNLYTAVIGDVLDVAGLTHQFLPPNIRALFPDQILVGRAMPVLEANSTGTQIGHSGKSEPFGLMFRALDALQPGDIYITTGCTPNFALWGGLMSQRAHSLGAQGAILDGYHRDTREILNLKFPVFSHGSYAQDQQLRGRVIDFRCSIEFGNGARVDPGDLIVGDIDGVVIVPKAHVGDIIAEALKKVAGEDAVRDMILKGGSTQDIFDKTGIM